MRGSARIALCVVDKYPVTQLRATRETVVHTQLNVRSAGLIFIFQHLPAQQHAAQRQLTLREIRNHDPLNRTANTSGLLIPRGHAELIDTRRKRRVVIVKDRLRPT